jgi:hypothetical protein
MKTVVHQSFRTANVPPWVERCLASVRAWAAANGYEYRFIDDKLFDYAGAAYCARVRHSMQAIANLARLELAREALEAGYDRAIWVDADVLVFDSRRLKIEIASGYAFCHEVWIEIRPDGSVSETRKVNNCVCVFTRSAPDLDILVKLVRHIVAHREIESSYTVGVYLLTALKPILGFPVLTNVGMFSPCVVRGLAAGDDRYPAIQARAFGHPVYAANLCTSLSAQIAEAEYMSAIDALITSRGDAINRFVPQPEPTRGAVRSSRIEHWLGAMRARLRVRRGGGADRPA